ncbi:hypothetical protein L842_3079 [Mycobacterium intracellulare MIN_052511_1280]|nr:hypothetical protein L842_3079 [Mycobacterium intracellulare MIN_052511_1280]
MRRRGGRRRRPSRRAAELGRPDILDSRSRLYPGSLHIMAGTSARPAFSW